MSLNYSYLLELRLNEFQACSYFALRHNYTECMRDTLAQSLPVPQQYHLPYWIRKLYKSRLDAAGLWTVHVEEVEEERWCCCAECRGGCVPEGKSQCQSHGLILN